MHNLDLLKSEKTFFGYNFFIFPKKEEVFLGPIKWNNVVQLVSFIEACYLPYNCRFAKHDVGALKKKKKKKPTYFC